MLVFEARRPDDASSPRVPGGRGPGGRSARWCGCGASWTRLERDHRLDFLRQPDLGFAWVAYRWAEGDDLDDVLGATDLAAGDFVRWMKQLIDLAGQVADAAGDAAALRETAREVALRRGSRTRAWSAYSSGLRGRDSAARTAGGAGTRRSVAAAGVATAPPTRFHCWPTVCVGVEDGGDHGGDVGAR